MTRKDFEKLEPGTKVWFKYRCFTLPMLGIIRREQGHNIIYVNFFGEGQGTWDYNDINDHCYLFEEGYCNWR